MIRIIYLILIVSFYFVPVCMSNETVAAGDRVRVDFTIRLTGGSLLITSRSDVADAVPQSKATVFMTLKQYGPVAVTAGPPVNAARKPVDKGFEGELLEQIGRAAVGFKVGETRKLILKSAVVPGLPEGERFLWLSRVRKRERKKKIQMSHYMEAYRSEPAIGKRLPFEPPIEAVVTAVDSEAVELELISSDGAAIATDFGPGTIRDKGQGGYEIVLDAKPGTLVRTEHLLGRIVSADDRRFTIDYGDLFGGEALECELTVVGIEQ